jgi:vacuolar protein sorting-associated protein 26
MSFFFKPPCLIDIEFSDRESRRTLEHRRARRASEKIYLFVGDESVRGQVHLSLTNPVNRVSHNGIRIDLIGQIELFYDRGKHYVFTSLQQELEPSGELTQNKSYPFEFVNIEKQHESYNGINVRLRYFLKVTILRSYVPDISKELDFWVHNYSPPPEINNSIKMEVGIEDCLHIEFEYNKSRYHLKDIVIGKIFFLLVRVKIKHMELQLIKRESTGTGGNLYNESETLTKYEIMDGVPVRGESVPVRMFLAAFDLTPTYTNVHSQFSLKYFINLVLVDEEDRRYFKQQEVIFWRKSPKKQRSKEEKSSTRVHDRMSSVLSSESVPEAQSSSSSSSLLSLAQ